MKGGTQPSRGSASSARSESGRTAQAAPRCHAATQRPLAPPRPTRQRPCGSHDRPCLHPLLSEPAGPTRTCRDRRIRAPRQRPWVRTRSVLAREVHRSRCLPSARRHRAARQARRSDALPHERGTRARAGAHRSRRQGWRRVSDPLDEVVFLYHDDR
eukprot:1763353-Prymnesium_polylepis.1